MTIIFCFFKVAICCSQLPTKWNTVWHMSYEHVQSRALALPLGTCCKGRAAQCLALFCHPRCSLI